MFFVHQMAKKKKNMLNAEIVGACSALIAETTMSNVCVMTCIMFAGFATVYLT